VLDCRLDAPHRDQTEGEGGDQVKHVVTLHAATIARGRPRPATTAAAAWYQSAAGFGSVRVVKQSTETETEPASVPLHALIPRPLKEWLEERAHADGISVGAALRQILSREKRAAES
jgi:hypothetical protein